VTFCAQAAIDADVAGRWRLAKRLVAPRGTRGLTKRDMVRNDALPVITVDPETYRVEADGELCTCEPLDRVPLGALYVLK
jgi:urease subunit alpha